MIDIEKLVNSSNEKKKNWIVTLKLHTGRMSLNDLFEGLVLDWEQLEPWRDTLLWASAKLVDGE